MPVLSSLAAQPRLSRGRLHPESDDGPRGPRDIFQRDRDRIIHSVAFRRLRHKTQVFVAPDGDHYRVRLTHSLEVAQIGRTIARALGLNEDLTEMLCLAHDLGHPPFGHAGEDALEEATADAGGFDHNGHTVRIVTRLETPYVGFDGLNLSWEALEGLAKHNGPVTDPRWALEEANAEFDLELDSWPSLEAQVAAIADDIAYDNHDIDDGLRAGLIDLHALLEVALVGRHWKAIVARVGELPREKMQRALVRDMIGTMVSDVIAETERRVAESGVRSIDEVRAAERQLAGFSAELRDEEKGLKRFLYDNLYNAPELVSVRVEAQRVVAGLARAYRSDLSLLPSEWRTENGETQQVRRIADFIAGMTDRFAIAQHAQLIGPVELPDRF
ncbi:deoxyguanosinetriphosphate triphosphohydrolase [Sphingomonas sp. RG327]|uniref:Deoxyguanosinetriphosphate triphosphohydrolase-like protein n=1 Tax=Sphingomonas anseongensis TaxID=2908207 RepID=A0ABT0RF06_9SPHN|nr:deoxyguanosinetriphosphate triphosphohydrolase [Sphingomonas anseongensis]MCL6678841.1 deoxyguanosinetriphosphate triphosphohydrolase [Sphingomonas anseongensis]